MRFFLTNKPGTEHKDQGKRAVRTRTRTREAGREAGRGQRNKGPPPSLQPPRLALSQRLGLGSWRESLKNDRCETMARWSVDVQFSNETVRLDAAPYGKPPFPPSHPHAPPLRRGSLFSLSGISSTARIRRWACSPDAGSSLEGASTARRRLRGSFRPAEIKRTRMQTPAATTAR